MYSLVMSGAATIKKYEVYRNHMVGVLNWIEQELLSPVVPAGISLEEKKQKLNQAKLECENSIKEFDSIMENLKKQMEEKGYGSVMELSEMVSKFLPGV